MNSLSQRLRWAMARAEINQAELARRCRVSQPSVHGWLSGTAKFLRGPNLLKASEVLDVEQEWLATGKGPRTRDDRTGPTAGLHRAEIDEALLERSISTALGCFRAVKRMPTDEQISKAAALVYAQVAQGRKLKEAKLLVDGLLKDTSDSSRDPAKERV